MGPRPGSLHVREREWNSVLVPARIPCLSSGQLRASAPSLCGCLLAKHVDTNFCILWTQVKTGTELKIEIQSIGSNNYLVSGNTFLTLPHNSECTSVPRCYAQAV